MVLGWPIVPLGKTPRTPSTSSRCVCAPLRAGDPRAPPPGCRVPEDGASGRAGCAEGVPSPPASPQLCQPDVRSVLRAGWQAGEGTGSLGLTGAECRPPQQRPPVGFPAGLNSGPHAACPSALTWDHAVGGDGTHGDGSQHRLQRHRGSSQKRGHFGTTPGPITDGLSHRQEDGLQDAQG